VRAASTNGDAQLAVSVWVRLLKTHALILREVRRRVPETLTLPQFDVLAQLHRTSDGMMPRELTRELLVTAGNLTGVISRLAALGLVERRPVQGDRRAVRIRLTPRGRRAMERAIPRHRKDVQRLLSHVASRDLGRLGDLLASVSGGLEGRS
jgi:DNA-binding MarR family transcriptional regulator